MNSPVREYVYEADEDADGKSDGQRRKGSIKNVNCQMLEERSKFSHSCPTVQTNRNQINKQEGRQASKQAGKIYL